MMDRSGVKSINTSVTFMQVAPTQPTSCLSFSQLNKVISRAATQNSTSPPPTYSAPSRTTRQQEVTLMRRNIDTSFTGLPECIKVTAPSLRRDSLGGRTAPPHPPVPVPSVAWRARCASRAAGTLSFSRCLWIWIGLE